MQTLDPSNYYVVLGNVASKGGTDPRDGTAYVLDKTACSACGTGARQVSGLRLKKSDLPAKSAIGLTFSDWILIRDDVVKKLVDRFAVKDDFRQVEERRSEEPLAFWQLKPTFTMPALAPETTGVSTEGQCKVCRRDGHFGTTEMPYTFAYRMSKKERAKLPVLASTWECFGTSRREAVVAPPDKPWLGRVVGFATPHVLARGDVCAALAEMVGAKRVRFEAVVFL